jgi:hypothetical protein
MQRVGSYNPHNNVKNESEAHVGNVLDGHLRPTLLSVSITVRVDIII